MTKQVLDVQQMQHLQELGLDTSNASASYCIDNETRETQLMWNEQVEDMDRNDPYFCIVPAYTLQDVLDALPKDIKYKEKICWLSFEISDEHIGYYYNDYLFRPTWVLDERLRVIDESIIDAAYKLLCRCIENGYVETNKNE